MAETAVTYLNQKGISRFYLSQMIKESDVYIERFIGYQRECKY